MNRFLKNKKVLIASGVLLSVVVVVAALLFLPKETEKDIVLTEGNEVETEDGMHQADSDEVLEEEKTEVETDDSTPFTESTGEPQTSTPAPDTTPTQDEEKEDSDSEKWGVLF